MRSIAGALRPGASRLPADRRVRSGSSRPTAPRRATAPTAAATGAARRVGRGSSAPIIRRVPVPRSRLARQVAAVGLVLCAVALSVAFPLRGYLEQRGEQAAIVAEQRALEQTLADLEAQKVALQDPDHIRAEARRRLQWVSPGDTVFVVSAPALTEQAAPSGLPAAPAGQPWYADLWDTLAEPVG